MIASGLHWFLDHLAAAIDLIRLQPESTEKADYPSHPFAAVLLFSALAGIAFGLGRLEFKAIIIGLLLDSSCLFLSVFLLRQSLRLATKKPVEWREILIEVGHVNVLHWVAVIAYVPVAGPTALLAAVLWKWVALYVSLGRSSGFTPRARGFSLLITALLADSLHWLILPRLLLP